MTYFSHFVEFILFKLVKFKIAGHNIKESYKILNEKAKKKQITADFSV